MEPYANQGGPDVPPEQSYQNTPVRPVANNMTVAALMLSVFALLTLTTGLFPILFGCLAILFAILSKGNNRHMDTSGKISTTLATVSVILGVVISAISFYEIKNDPEVHAKFNATFKQVYGVDFDTYWDGMQHYYETGETPDFMKDGSTSGKEDIL